MGRRRASSRSFGSASQIEPISGAVAQLGERELCKLEVVGSIPIGSTSLRLQSMRGLSAEAGSAKVDGGTCKLRLAYAGPIGKS
jgi:hypothetical protein